MNPEFQYELDYLSATLPELESYLLAKDLYRIVHISLPRGFPPYPSMTLGSILLSLHKARVLGINSQDSVQVIKREQILNDIRHRWKTAWEKKAMAELQNRVAMWRTFLSELYGNPSENIDRYPYEVRQRVIIELLQDELDDLSEPARSEIEQTDGLLRNILQPSSFIWAAKLEKAFPSNHYWFLYGKP